jgi:acylphosphatase
MTDMIRRRVEITGRVQGVGFRWSTAEQAQRLGVAGWARNLDDGRVRVEAEGAPADVRALVDWLRHGPAMARVDSLDVTEVDTTGQHGFVAR